MNNIVLLLILVVGLQGETFGAQPDLKDKVTLQVSRIKSISGFSESYFFELPGASLYEKDSPLVELINCGMDAIPYLVPYLSDTTPTQAVRVHGSGIRKRVAVNEYVIFIINKIADHSFYLPVESESTGALEDRVLAWWRENRTRSLSERKIIDLNDPIHENRFSAYEWFGRTKSNEGRIPLEKRIDSLLMGEVNTLKQSEMAACAESLGRIGNNVSAQAVRKVCDHLSYWVYMAYRPEKEGRSGSGSDQITTLFRAYEALARLGFKDEALSKLKELKTKYLAEMEPPVQTEYLGGLQKAIDW